MRPRSIGRRNSPPPKPIRPPMPPISRALPRAIVVARQPDRAGAMAGATALIMHPLMRYDILAIAHEARYGNYAITGSGPDPCGEFQLLPSRFSGRLPAALEERAAL